MDEKYYRKQIEGLLLIVGESNNMMARSYIREKLEMILKDGINFHPIIKEALGLEEKNELV